MFIIKITPDANGSRPPLQSWNKPAPPDGYALIDDERAKVFYSTSPAGFVNLTVSEDGIVIGIEINKDALAAYQTTLPDPIISARENKLNEIKQACENKIYGGTNVTYSDGTTEHFTYTLADQSNISEMFTAIMAGATEFPYHADDEICKVYSKAQIVTIYGTLSLFKAEATTYHNSLKAQINAMTDIDTINTVKFNETALEGEYLENYKAMMASVQAQLDTVLAKIPSDTAE